MDALKKHAVFTAVAAIVGLGLVWWLQPTTNGGTGLVFAMCLLLCNAVAAFVKMPAGAAKDAK